MISAKNIETIFSDCGELGYDVEYKDIVYCLIVEVFEEPSIAYYSVFGGTLEEAKVKVIAYNSLGKITFLKAHLSLYTKKENAKSKKEIHSITYDENLADFLSLRSEIREKMERGEIENLGGYKALLDISVKLNDKFKINDDNKGQVVVVETKYNDVCSYCQHEVARAPITKEEAMKMYNLVEK